MSEIHGENIPEDKVEITEEEHLCLMDGQCNGKVIASEQGRPILTDIPPPTEAEALAISNAEILRQIQDLETTLQPRAMRDMLLYEDITRLLDLEEQIIDLRAQLQ